MASAESQIPRPMMPQRGMHSNPYVDQLMRNSLRAIVRTIEFEATTGLLEGPVLLLFRGDLLVEPRDFVVLTAGSEVRTIPDSVLQLILKSIPTTERCNPFINSPQLLKSCLEPFYS